jgi:hypothetical protein
MGGTNAQLPNGSQVSLPGRLTIPATLDLTCPETKNVGHSHFSL